MKFNDIKEFPNSYYSVDIPWAYLERWIEDHKDELTNIDMNPFFQRGYVWKEKQKIAYIEYILKNGFSSRDIFWNHPYWGRFTKPASMVLVDGKQGISAVLDFLNNKIKAFGFYYKEYEGSVPHHCGFKMHINNLKSEKDVVEWYIGLNTGGSIHTDKDLKSAVEYLKGEK